MTVVDALTWVCMVGGSAFSVVAAIGVIRLPDFYSRAHAAGMSDTMGAGLVLLGLILQSGATLVSVKLVTVWLFLWLTSPAATHAVAKAAYYRGVRVYGEPRKGSRAPAH